MKDLWGDDFDDANESEQNFDWDDADVVEDTASAVSPTQMGGTGNEFISDDFDSTWDDTQTVPIVEESKPKASKKAVAIGFLVFIILAVVILLTVKNGIEQKKAQELQEQMEATETEAPDDSYDKYDNKDDEDKKEEPEVNVSSQDLILKRIPDKTVVDYSGEILESDAKVASKDKYLVDGQVIYCVGLKIAVGNTSQTVSYYCNYSVFQKLSLGDLLTVKYQQIDDKYISVTDVLK